MKSTFRFIFYVTGALTIMFFLGAFNEGMGAFQRFVIFTSATVYSIMPYALLSGESTRVYIEDQRNALILGVCGIFIIAALAETAAYGLLSMQFLIASIMSIAVMLMCISSIWSAMKKEDQKNTSFAG